MLCLGCIQHFLISNPAGRGPCARAGHAGGARHQRSVHPSAPGLPAQAGGPGGRSAGVEGVCSKHVPVRELSVFPSGGKRRGLGIGHGTGTRDSGRNSKYSVDLQNRFRIT